MDRGIFFIYFLNGTANSDILEGEKKRSFWIQQQIYHWSKWRTIFENTKIITNISTETYFMRDFLQNFQKMSIYQNCTLFLAWNNGKKSNVWKEYSMYIYISIYNNSLLSTYEELLET